MLCMSPGFYPLPDVLFVHRRSLFNLTAGCHLFPTTSSRSLPSLPSYDVNAYPYHHGYPLPSHVQKLASPLLPPPLLHPESSTPPHPFSSITLNIHLTLSSGVMIPSTSQSTAIFAMSVLTSPGCSARMVVGKGRKGAGGGVGAMLECEEEEEEMEERFVLVA